MIGGLLKSSSKLALMAAAGILVGGVSMGSAKAADLGGDCCADLEERVAELEATTARKGNRKVSLTLSGQVTRNIMYWNDGTASRTYAGIDNRAASSRFNFNGDAKITSSVKAGFEISVDWGIGAITSSVSNAASTSTFLNSNAPGPNVDGGWGADGLLAIRTANWWLEDKVLGRVTVGRVELGGAQGTIDLGGIGTGAAARPMLGNAAMQFRTSAGALSGLTFTNSSMGHCFGCDRSEGIRYDSQSLAGFTFGAYWGENDVATAQVRYAGEFGGIRIAAGIGGQWQSRAGQVDGTSFGAVATGVSVTSLTNRPVDDYGAALSLMHTSSGLFAQGHYAWSDYRISAGNAFDRSHSTWLVQAGIAKNWFGPGATALYGEYGKGTNTVLGNGVSAALGTTALSGSDSDMWGLGINQKIDAAAMELYVGWRHYTLSTTNVTVGAVGFQDMDVIQSGARIRF